MTLSGRNNLFKAGIVLASLCVLWMIIASIVVIPAYSLIDTENVRRSEGLIQIFIGQFLKINFYAVHMSLAEAILYALISLILIYHFFEQTHAPEILFIAAFVVSLAFEAARLILPLHWIYDIPSLYLLMASRVLLFGRYFGTFSLFAASVCASGLDVQKTRNSILVILGATLIISLGVPIDTQTWDSSLSMVNGYTSMFRLIEAGTFLTTLISFFIAAYSRGSREYALIGVGAFLSLLGRTLLLEGDTWISPILGILLLSAGTWFICIKLHKVYLWL
ncbi:hypothetical protein AGMMS50293_21680 [Spirochaetia bacterium]|nr:hypothetical protein AGMMS50293_21680 [Spirochaetia bacterium]